MHGCSPSVGNILQLRGSGMTERGMWQRVAENISEELAILTVHYLADWS